MDKAIEVLKNAKLAAILPHTNPDMDALSSSFVLAEIIRGYGGAAHVLLEDAPAKNLLSLGGDYKVYPVEGPFSGYDLVVAVDVGDIQRLGTRLPIFSSCENTLNIDHHVTNTLFARTNLIEDAAAVAEILYWLMVAAGLYITPDIARKLYMGISSDTGSFAYPNTGAKTHRTAAALIEAGADVKEINIIMHESVPLPGILLQGAAINSLKLFCGGKVSVISITEEDMRRAGAGEEDAEGVSSISRKLAGVEVGVLLKEVGNKVRISLRSKRYIDVAAIAQALGGGGHVQASGATVDGPLEGVLQRVVDLCEKAFEDAGDN